MTDNKPAWMIKAQKWAEEKENKQKEAQPVVDATPATATQTRHLSAVPNALPIIEIMSEPGEVAPPNLPAIVKSSDQELDTLIDNIDVLDAYRMWCGKMVPNVSGGQRESIMISCPNPNHADKNPSAFINLDKGNGGVWHCAACGEGGDKWDIAASHFGIADYKSGQKGKKFNDLRREIAKAHGWSVEKRNGFDVTISPAQAAREADEAQQSAQRASAAAQAPAHHATTPLHVVPDEPDDVHEYPNLDWKSCIKPDTFLDLYMQATTVDSAPEEFHFWNALQALGLAAGRNVWMKESSRFYPNIYTCIVGTTGSGKTKSRSSLKRVLAEALPYDSTHANKDGVYVMPRAGSGEAIVNMFKGEHYIAKGVPPLTAGNVKGLIDFEEISDIIGRSARLGSTMKETIQSLYDGSQDISNFSKSGGMDVAVKPFCCLSAGVQPDKLRELLTKSDSASGFLNRFIFVTGTYKTVHAIETTEIDLTLPAELLKSVQQWSAQGVELDWDADAMDRFVKFYIEFLEIFSRDTAPAILKRMSLTIKKLIMLFSINAQETKISLESVNFALNLYNYLVFSYKMVESKVTTSEKSEMQEYLLKYITDQQNKSQAGFKWIKTSDLCNLTKMRGLRDEVISALRTLEDTGALAKTYQIPGSRKSLTAPAYLPRGHEQ